jgi:hypothetical protein
MWCGVDEVCKAQQCGAEAYGGAIEGGDENLGMGIEGLSGIEVVGDKALEPLGVGVLIWVGFAGDPYVGASATWSARRTG